MHPKVKAAYQKFGKKYEMQGPFLEVGAGEKETAILSGSYFRGKEQRFATNLSEKEVGDPSDGKEIQFVRCNANDMKDAFADGQFGTVLCNAMIEHDKYFWRSIDEMKRVLAPGGILAIGAPGYIERRFIDDDIISDKHPKATVTIDLHSRPDYWRFSRMAFKEIICEGLELLELAVVLKVPIILAVARKPLEGMLEKVAQTGRSAEEQEAAKLKWQARKARAAKKAAREAKVQSPA